MIDLKCRRCGKTVDFRKFGPGKICPNCGKETASVDIKEVHVEFSHVRWGDPSNLPRETENDFWSGIDYVNICFNLDLCVGDISSAPRSNYFVYAHERSSCKSVEMSIEGNIKRLSHVSNNAVVYLWINERDVNAYMNLLKFAELFKRFDKVYLIRCCSKENEKNDNYKPNDSFEQKKRLSCDDLDAMTTQYSEIVKLGGDYRLGAYGVVRPYLAKDLESFVLCEVNESYVGYNALYDKARNTFEKTFGYIFPYDIFREIIWNLMLKRQIRVKGPFAWWGEFSIYGCTEFCLEKQRHVSIYTYEDALVIVRDAFEIGCTLQLYDLIAEDACLKCDDGILCRGKKEIIEFIEDYGATRVNFLQETVQGEVVKITEGKSFCAGERCVLINYRQEDEGISDYIILRVDFQGDRIQEIQMIDIVDIEKPCGFEAV